MSDTLVAIIIWTVIFAVILTGIFIYAYTKVYNNLRDYKNKDCNKGLTDEAIIKKETFNEAKYAILFLGIAFFFFFGIATCTDSCFEKRPQPKIDNPYEGSKEQQEDIDFANELIKEDMNKNK
jgi:heme/copper-type cytochrome/quinol oxidase subunit 2